MDFYYYCNFSTTRSALRFLCLILLIEIAFGRSTENYPVATTTQISATTSEKTRYEKGLEDYDEAQARAGRGMMMMDYADHDDSDHDHDDHDMMKDMKEMPEQKAVKEDPWAGYYDLIINEGSFKFWSVFQLLTALLLVYSAFAAVYYAKFNVITSDYDYYDDFFARSNTDPAVANKEWSGLSAQTFQRIFDALSSKKYS